MAIEHKAVSPEPGCCIALEDIQALQHRVEKQRPDHSDSAESS